MTLVKNSFFMAIAGLGVSLICPSAEMVTRLSKRYKYFIPSGETHLTIHIRNGNASNAPRTNNQLIDFHHGVVKIQTDRMIGKIYIDRGSGELLVLEENSIAEIEYFIRAVYAILGFLHGGLLVHSAGIVHNGMTYLFFGHSGCGKTTVAKLSKDKNILSDDLILVLPVDGEWIAYGTPFWNPGWGSVKPGNAPIHSIFRLIQGTTNNIEEINKSLALAEIISSIPVIPVIDIWVPELINRCLYMFKDINVYRLYFRKEPSFWGVIDGSNVVKD